HCLVDDNHELRTGAIEVCKEAAFLQWNTQRVQILARHLRVKSRRLAALRRRRTAYDCERRVQVQIDERRGCNYGSRLDGGKTSDLLEGLIEEADHLFGLVVSAREEDLQCQYVLFAESRIDLKQANKTSQQ